MPIRPGQQWGTIGTVDRSTVSVTSDAAAALIVSQALVEGKPPPIISLLGGDLWRTLGSPQSVPPGPTAMLLPVDLGSVEVDHESAYHFIAHAVVRGRTLWRAPQVIAMNAAWYGEYNLGPSAHPNDGLLDITAGGLPRAQRRAGKRRSRSGAHLPHPDLTHLRSAEYSIDVTETQLFVDGVSVGSGSHFHFTVIENAGVIAI